MSILKIEGQTPDGKKYVITKNHLNWLPSGEVGSIGIPLKDGVENEIHKRLSSGKRWKFEERLLFLAC